MKQKTFLGMANFGLENFKRETLVKPREKDLY
jgi:hypothetical protein